MPNTVELHRVFKTTPDKLYRAFTEPDALLKWIPPYGFIAKITHMDVKVGGSFKMSFTNFGTGKCESFGGNYIELVPNELIRYTDKFDDPNLAGEIEVKVTFKKVCCGTEINIKQSGLPDIIPVEMCYLGWQESLEQLAKLVQPDIPDSLA